MARIKGNSIAVLSGYAAFVALVFWACGQHSPAGPSSFGGPVGPIGPSSVPIGPSGVPVGPTARPIGPSGLPAPGGGGTGGPGGTPTPSGGGGSSPSPSPTPTPFTKRTFSTTTPVGPGTFNTVRSDLTVSGLPSGA